MLEVILYAVILGIAAVVTARLLHIPPVVMLLFTGIIAGPEVLNIINPAELGRAFRALIALTVAVILFEGGLSLNYHDYRKAGKIIKRLLSYGVIISFGVTAAAVHFLFELPLLLTLLAGAIMILNGPSVINSLIKKINPPPRISRILHWESVLVDPLGELAAVLIFAFVVSGHFSGSAILFLELRMLAGIALGIGSGYVVVYILQKHLLPDDTNNIFILGAALLTYWLCELIIIDSGILGVIVCGFTIGFRRPPDLENIKKFKADLTAILTGVIFILLAANLHLEHIKKFGYKGLILVGVIILIVRPLSVFLCTIKTELHFKEKLLLSWIYPRGVVAASIAILFSLQLSEADILPVYQGRAWFIEIFTFAVIATTAVGQSVFTPVLARMLGLYRRQDRNWLIVGANELSRYFYDYITKGLKQEAVIMDTNSIKIKELAARGLQTVLCNASTIDYFEDERFFTYGNLLALTDNDELNIIICQHWAAQLSAERVFRWSRCFDSDRKKNRKDGKPVLSNIPGPSLINEELVSGKSRIITVNPAVTKVESDFHLLAGTDNHTLSLFPVKLRKENAAAFKSLMVLRRGKDNLQQIIKKNNILILSAADLQQLFQKIITEVYKRYPAIRQDRMIEEVLDHEKKSPTALGNGFAIPHSFSPNIIQPLIFIIRLPDGMKFRSFNREKTVVRMLFFMISPANDPERHLQLQSQIAAFISDKEKSRALLTAASIDEIAEIFTAPG
ncbi:MAG TPA: cation:proton antiporter [Spirochaetota bacterium]|nr:cation:proton antiporter [Spirochaetota bacterium]